MRFSLSAIIAQMREQIRRRKAPQQTKSAFIRGDTFYVHNGETIETIHELALLLTHIAESDFRHHVNEERNDFSNWIADSLNDCELASQIRETNEREEMLSQIIGRINKETKQ